jgi:DNA-binding response OmpR family regulator
MNGKRILIVDDEIKVRKLIEVTLASEKREILHASSGEEAIEIARKAKPDLMLLDIMMPGKFDGFDVCKAIKEDPETRGIYVIMLTAKGQQVDKDKGLALGADDYFVKPFSPMELLEKIEKNIP